MAGPVAARSKKEGEPLTKAEKKETVTEITDALFEQYCGEQSNLYSWEDDFAQRILAIDKKADDAQDQFDKIFDEFFSELEEKFPFGIVEQKINYNTIQAQIEKTRDADDFCTILDRRLLRKSISKAVEKAVENVSDTAKGVIVKRNSGADAVMSEEIMVGFGPVGENRESEDLIGLNNLLIDQLKEKLGETLEAKGVAFNIGNPATSESKILMLRGLPLEESTEVSVFTGEAVGAKKKKPENPFKHA